MLCCLMCKYPQLHQLTNAGLENSETQLKKCCARAECPQLAGGRASAAVYLLSLYQATVGEEHFKL